MKPKVIIDPRSSFQYSSFYVKGLYDYVGPFRIRFSMCPFRGLPDLENDMRFIIRDGKNDVKYFIHANDNYKIKEKDYQWCDVYGCVNTNFEAFSQSQYPKLVALCPSFAIVPNTILFSLWMGICCCAQSFNTILNRAVWNVALNKHEISKSKNFRHYWGRLYKGITNRPHYEQYAPCKSQNNYIFFLSTLWYSDQWNKNDDGVNLRRANFIRACKSMVKAGKVTFEGGFSNRSTSNTAELFKDCLSNGVDMKTWMEKTHQSAIVFNTPAFWNCHGWKLGEYLAMGKCIVSTKLSNDLPAPLVHGKNIHFVEDSEEAMREAIKYILAHPAYKEKLENGARDYWNKYGSPKASLKLLGLKVD